MKYISLIWSSMFRKKTRTVLTLLSIMVAFLLFGLLQVVQQAFSGSANNAATDRLITNSKYSIIDTLPVSYQKRIAAIAHVKAVTFTSWFGGSYQDKPASFAVFPVVPDEYLAVMFELQVSSASLRAWNSNRTAAVVEDVLAEQMKWKIGDKVTLQADIWPQNDGSLNWTFDIVGTFHNTKGQGGGNSMMLIRHDYFDEARQYGKGTIGWFVSKLDDPQHASQVGKMIDTEFANSEHETKTQTEQAFAQGFVKQFGDIGLIVKSILGAVFFTILVLAGNTMSQAMRERIPELGILKTLGFSDAKVCAFILVESLLMSCLGAVLGLSLAALTMSGLQEALSGIGITSMSGRVVAEGMAIAALLGGAVGILPAIKAKRLNIVDALNS